MVRLTSTRPAPLSPNQLVSLYLVCFLSVIFYSDAKFRQVNAFHLSFGHRLFKQQTIQQQKNPQLNPASTLIRPIECRNANNHSEVGICMFSIDCMQNKGVPLSICKHNYFVGTCCRLPDYNNFVGIVYDLRDTEAANQLEARKTMISAANNLMSTPAAAPTTNPSETNLIVTTTQPPESTSAPTQQQQQQSALSSESSPASPLKASERLEEKYVIASASLFPSPTTTVSPQQQATGPSEQQSARNADGSVGQSSSFNNQQVVSFATDHWPAQAANSQQQATSSSHSSSKLGAPSDLVDTFQIQTAPPTTTTNAESNSTVELIKLPNEQLPPTVEFSSSSSNKQMAINSSSAYELISVGNTANEQLGTGEVLSSAHSAPATTTTGPPASTQVQQQLPTNNSLSNEQADRASLVDSNADDPKQATTTTTIVLSNQHQPATPPRNESGADLADIAHKITSQFVAHNNGDQEFVVSPAATLNLTKVPPADCIPGGHDCSLQQMTSSTTAASPTESSTSSPTVDVASTASHGPAEQQPTVASSTSVSPFVDLISSPSPPPPSSSSSSQAQQTTTPDFTSSLSTVSLPIVNSHPYSPTTSTVGPPAQTTIQSQALVSPNSSAAAEAAPAATTITKASEQANQQQQQQHLHSSPSELGNLQSNSFMLSSLLNSASSSSNNNQRPSLLLANSNLQATSKIVAAPTTNHLIPGLSGLQSAILSHIPFKIASGLSSGLSSYLQAAMNKPANSQLGSVQGGRPLLSSNTATALQYQQQQNSSNSNSNSNSSATKPSHSSVAIKFPSATTAQPSGANSSNQISFAASSPQSTTKHNSSTQTSEAMPRDIVREAQLVCGRPQVTSSQWANSLAPSDSNSIQSTPGAQSKRRIGRIVGGNQSWFGQWPWMVSLRQWRKGAFLHKCGAALLNEHWAITAAHCVENVKASDLLLRLGEFDVSKHDEPFPFVERRVKTIVSHPSFDPKTFEYDLALLRFTEPIGYERNIVPVCVPQGNDSYVDRMATVIGWGRLYEDGPLPDVIQHVDVPIITNNECERMYKNAGYIEEIPEMFICAGINKGGRDSCEGDSGGPLTMVDHDGRSYLVGIISWGIGCALPSQPGVYTRITAFSGWINALIAN